MIRAEWAMSARLRLSNLMTGRETVQKAGRLAMFAR
jgi:hypothetical protein